MDKFFKGVFTTIDESKTLQKGLGIIGLDTNPASTQPLDRSICSIHRIKKTFFCESCLYDVCTHCKDKHDKTHPVKFIEESANYVIERFMESLDGLKNRKVLVNEASNRDPTLFPLAEGCVNILE